MPILSYGCPCCAMPAAFRAPADAGGGAGSPASGGPVDPALFADLATASHILTHQNVLDAFGHVSMRHPDAPDRYFIPRSLSPGMVTADDIMEYTIDSVACGGDTRRGFLERFIHGEIYRTRPDVMAIVHSHSASVIPFGIVRTPMRAMYHNAAFLAPGVPIFDIAEKFGATDMLVTDIPKGAALAEALGDKAVALMRGHGSVAVGPDLKTAVFRAVYTEVNARVQHQTTAYEGPVRTLTEEEGVLADEVNIRVIDRIWNVWAAAVADRS